MEEMEISYPKKSQRSARRFRVLRLLVFAALAFGLMLFLFGALVRYDMRRPVAPPLFILPADLTTASLALLSDAPATQLLQPSQPTTRTLASAPASTATLPASASPQASSPPAARDLLPEAALPCPEKQQAARKINAAFRQLQTDFAALQRERKHREDPDVPTDEELESLKNVYVNYTLITAHLRTDFGPPATEQFEKIFLGFMISSRDWRLAARHCSMRQDWDGAIYCARQAGYWDERVLIVYCSGARIVAKVRNLFRPNR